MSGGHASGAVVLPRLRLATSLAALEDCHASWTVHFAPSVLSCILLFGENSMTSVTVVRGLELRTTFENH